MKSGNLNFLQPSGHLRPVTGLLYLIYWLYWREHVGKKNVKTEMDLGVTKKYGEYRD